MTREEVKAALKSYRALKREHDDLVRRREEIEASILGSPRLDGMPHGGSVSNPTANSRRCTTARRGSSRRR